jgi:hypothetical protein
MADADRGAQNRDHEDHQRRIGELLTLAVLRRGAAVVLEAALEGEHASLVIDGVMRMSGPSRLGPFHYIPVLVTESGQVVIRDYTGREWQLLLRRLSSSGPTTHR